MSASIRLEVPPYFYVVTPPPQEGRVLHKYFSSWVQLVIKMWTQSDLKFCKNEGSKRLMKKGGNWIENLYKMLKKF